MGALTITAKYLVVVNFEVQGSVDKPDVIGAIFSQTEGLLGHDLDLRDLQLSGRIGRIEVELEKKGDKTIGKLYVPSNLNRYETALVAAAIETIDRVGPYVAKFRVVEVRDLREEKRRRILERAKEIVSSIEHEVLPDSKELINKLIEAVSEAELIRYGPEGLPAGPDVDKADTIIIVEGRADVLNLLRHGYRNVIAVGGASSGIPKTIIELSKRKTTIAFVDGDRGGEMLLKELVKVADVDYVARAPPGKEVEELTAKEITKALKNKVPVEEYLSQLKEEVKVEVKEKEVEIKPEIRVETKAEAKVEVERVEKPEVQVQVQQHPIPLNVVEQVKKLIGTLEAIVYDENWNEIKKTPVRELIDTLQQLDKAYAIVLDGVCTQRLVDIASNKGVKLIVTSRIGSVTKVPTELTLLTFDDLIKQ